MQEKLINNKEKKTLISNIFSLMVLQGANYVLPLLTFPYLVRILGVDGFGLLAFATAIVSYFSIITDYGFNLTATRDVSINQGNIEKITEIFSSVMIIKMLLFLISLVVFLPIITLVEDIYKDYMIYLMTFGTVLGQVLFPVWLFQGLEKMKYITYINLFSKLIFTISIFYFVNDGDDILMVPLLNSLGGILSGVISLFVIVIKFRVSFKVQSITVIRNYLFDGWHIFLSRLLGSLYRNTNIVILGIIANTTIVGFYSIAERIIKIIQSFQDVFGNALYPLFSRKIRGIKDFHKIEKKYMKYIIFIYFLASTSIFLLSEFIIYLLNGRAESHMVINLKIMSFVILVGGMNYYYGILGLIPLAQKKAFTKYIMYTGIINVFLCSILGLLFQDAGVAITFLLSECFLFLCVFNKIRNLKRIIYAEPE